MLPVAAGANGQPPIPPFEESSQSTPHSSAVNAFANPVLRVLWKCARVMTSGATERTPSSNVRTWLGTPTPTVSAMAISFAPAAAERRASSRTRSGGTSPSKGQPNDTAMVTVANSPVDAASATTSSATAVRASVDEFWLALEKPSEAGTTTLISSTPAATARSKPRRLSTRPM